MEIGLGTYAADWSIGASGRYPPDALDAFSFLDLAEEYRFRRVQIADNLPLGNLSSHERARLKARADDRGIVVEVGIRGIIPENLTRYVGIAEEFGSPVLRAIIDKGEFRPDILETTTILREHATLLEEHGIVLALENHDRFRARDFVRILEETGSPWVGICLDTANSFGALEGPEVVIDTLLPWTVNLHIKDFGIRRLPHDMGFEVFGTPAGEGRLDIPALVERIDGERSGVTGIVELWPAPEESLQATVQKEREWIRRSRANLVRLGIIESEQLPDQ